MQIQRTVLNEAIKKCLPGVETGTALIEGSDTLVFTKGGLHSYNDSIHVSAILQDSEIVGCVKAKEFSKLISSLVGDVVTITEVEGKWVLTCGATEVELALYSDNITQFVAALKIEEVVWKPLPADFSTALRLTKIAGNNNPVRGAFISGNKLFSTDTIRINEYTFDSDLLPFWIDDPSVSELLKIGELVEYDVGTAWAHFKTKDGAIFSAKLKEYSLFPVDGLKAHIFNALTAPTLAGNHLPLALADAVSRVSVFGADLQGVISVTLAFRKDYVEARSGRATGKAKERVSWAKPFDKDPAVDVLVDYTFIVEAAGKTASFELKEIEGAKILRFYSEKYNQLAVTVAA